MLDAVDAGESTLLIITMVMLTQLIQIHILGVDDEELDRLIESSIAAHKACRSVLSAQSPSLAASRKKLLRGSDKLRRACLKTMDRSPGYRVRLRRVLECIVDDYDHVLQVGVTLRPLV
jgi:hypothetical protein